MKRGHHDDSPSSKKAPSFHPEEHVFFKRRKRLLVLIGFGLAFLLSGSSIFEFHRIQASSSALKNRGRRDYQPASPVKWAIFTVPKPYAASQVQIVAMYSWTMLRNPPSSIYMIQDKDVDASDMEGWKQLVPLLQILPGLNVNGKMQYDIVFERASREPVDVVVVINADIVLYDDFLDALEHIYQESDRFLMIGARYDSSQELTPSDFALNRTWLQQFRTQTLRTGQLHTFGGSDYFAWKPVGYSHYSAVGGPIPPFVFGRPKADNWIIDRARYLNNVDLVDATGVVNALHLRHGYKHIDSNLNESTGRYSNIWSKATHEDITFNKYLAYTYGNFINQDGTPLHATWIMAYCSSPKSRKYVCMRRRIRRGACSCEHGAFVKKTQSDPKIIDTQVVCGNLPMYKTETFTPHEAFEMLLNHRTDEHNQVIIIGYHTGSEGMLSNMICRFNQLEVHNFLVAAFDEQAMQSCRELVVPCFAAYVNTTSSGVTGQNDIDDFQGPQKVKAFYALKILKKGKSLLWCDVDLFWKINVMEWISSEIKLANADIAIHHHSTEMGGLNNSEQLQEGFFYAKNTPEVVRLFAEMIKVSNNKNTLFDAMCEADQRSQAIDSKECHNEKFRTKTLLVRAGTVGNIDSSPQSVGIIHFPGDSYQEKIELLKEQSMWWLQENTTHCKP